MSKQVEEVSRGISAVVNNAVLSLWVTNQKTAAKAKLQFSVDTSTYGKMVKQQGYTLFHINSTNAVLQDQFPECMFFVVPSKLFSEIAALVSRARKEAIYHLEIMEKQAQSEWSPSARTTGMEADGLPDAYNPLNLKN